MTYIEAAVIPIAETQVDRYLEIAEKISELWMDHGALEYRECPGEDLDPEMGGGFPSLTGLASDETVILSLITFESRAHRDEVKAVVMEDDRMGAIMAPEGPPFDPSRMVSGGFEVLIEG